MSRINAYIGFNGNCREAMTFYQQCFGGELSFTPVGESPVCDQLPPGSEDKIMHSMLANGDLVLMGTEMCMEGEYPAVSNISLAVQCGSEDEIDRYFAHLAQDGRIQCPLGPSFWGIKFGAVTDKFGISWALDYSEAR